MLDMKENQNLFVYLPVGIVLIQHYSKMNKLEIVLLVVSVLAAGIPSMEAFGPVSQSDPAQSMPQQDSVIVNDESMTASNMTMDGERSGAEPRCIIPPPVITHPSLPSITYSSNCDFCDHDLYTLTCIPNALVCAARCAADRRCTHFTYISNIGGGTCRLKSAPGSGGAWASLIPAPSAYICGYIPRRAFTSILLSLCIGLDISIGIL